MDNHATFNPSLLNVAQNTNTVTTANGNAAHLKNGILFPFFALQLSEKFAIIGSVTASNTLPNAVIKPIIVNPKKIAACGMNVLIPPPVESGK